MEIKDNFKQTIRIARIELSSLFYSPMAWLILIIFAVMIGYDFAHNFTRHLESMDRGREVYSLTYNIYTSWMGGMLNPLLKNLYMFFPLITMGLMSREYQSGSIKLLYSSPINNTSIILGKFLAMMIYGLALMAILGATVLFSGATIVNFNYQVLLVAMMGIYLLILAYSAIGLFMSSITQYQVVAAIGTFAVLTVLNYIGDVGQSIDFVRDVTYWLSIYGRSKSFILGLLPSADVFYFLIVICLFLGLSIFKLNTEKSIMSAKVKTLKYSLIIGVALFLGYISSLPSMKLYYDGTYNKSNTLSKESQEAIKDLEGKLTITTYVNLLAQEVYAGLPWNRNNDIARYQKYARFKPDLEMKYVYYYDQSYNPELDEKYPNMSLREKAEQRCKTFSLDIDDFMTPEEFKKVIDLSDEGNQFIRLAETENGKKIFLRVFADTEKHPREAEISATLKRLTKDDAPVVGFMSGYGARNTYNYGPRGYYLFVNEKWARFALPNQGFDTKTVNLDKGDIEEDIDILVIADVREPLSEQAMERLKRYIDKGGNLFILGEYGRNDVMHTITEPLGVTFSENILASDSKLISPSVTMSQYNPEMMKEFSMLETLYRWGYGVSMPTTLAINYQEKDGFRVKPVMQTSDQSWIENETTDFVDGEFVCNEAAGEKKGVYSTMVRLSRMVGEKEQRILISGDADMISNGELNAQRPGSEANNLGLISGVFRWFSNDKYPIDTSVSNYIDNGINLPHGSSWWVNLLFIILIPGALIYTGIYLIVRRQRK